MASRLTAGTLTVTITEALSVTHNTSADNRSHAQTLTKTFASIDNIDGRILNLPNTNQVKVADLVDNGSEAGAPGAFKRSAVEYIRITNLDDSNAVGVILEDTGGDVAGITVDPDASFILTSTDIEANAGGTAVTARGGAIDEIFLRADSANVQVEVLIATTA
jgi:hypothetical protein